MYQMRMYHTCTNVPPSDGSYIYQLSLVVATAAVSFVFLGHDNMHLCLALDRTGRLLNLCMCQTRFGCRRKIIIRFRHFQRNWVPQE